MTKPSKRKPSNLLSYPKATFEAIIAAMTPSPSPPRCPIPPNLRMTPANKALDKKDGSKASVSGDDGGSSSTAATGQENRHPRITFGSCPSPPRCPIPPSLRMTPANKADDKKDEPKASGSGDEGDRVSTAGIGQENRNLRVPSTPRTSFAVLANDGSGNSGTNRITIPGLDPGASPTDQGSENLGTNKPTRTSPIPVADSTNDGSGNSGSKRTPSPRPQPDADPFRGMNSEQKKRKQKRMEKTLDSEYRRDLLASEGIAFRDFQVEADARKEQEGSPKKKWKKAAPYESPVRPLVLRPTGRPPETNIPIRDLRVQVIAQTGFETHFEGADPDLEEEELYAPEVENIEPGDTQRPLIIPIRHGSCAQYPAGCTADRVDLHLREQRRDRMAVQRARIIREANRRGRELRESIEAKAAAEAHAAAVAHAEAVANDNGEDKDEDEDDEEDAGD